MLYSCLLNITDLGTPVCLLAFVTSGDLYHTHNVISVNGLFFGHTYVQQIYSIPVCEKMITYNGVTLHSLFYSKRFGMGKDAKLDNQGTLSEAFNFSDF